jgi:hypothetical protein
MRLISDQPALDAAMRAEETIIETYRGPDRTISELMDYATHQGKTNFMVDFGAACRKDLAARAMAI